MRQLAEQSYTHPRLQANNGIHDNTYRTSDGSCPAPRITERNLTAGNRYYFSTFVLSTRLLPTQRLLPLTHEAPIRHAGVPRRRGLACIALLSCSCSCACSRPSTSRPGLQSIAFLLLLLLLSLVVDGCVVCKGHFVTRPILSALLSVLKTLPVANLSETRADVCRCAPLQIHTHTDARTHTHR